VERDTRRADRTPVVAGGERFNLAHDGRAIDRRIAQPITVTLSEYEVPPRTTPSLIDDPVDHDATAGEKGDDVPDPPHVLRTAADSDARAVGDRRSHAGAAHIRMDNGARFAGQGAQPRQIVDCWRPGRACYQRA
jgi:hypothetical protein